MDILNFIRREIRILVLLAYQVIDIPKWLARRWSILLQLFPNPQIQYVINGKKRWETLSGQKQDDAGDCFSITNLSTQSRISRNTSSSSSSPCALTCMWVRGGLSLGLVKYFWVSGLENFSEKKKNYSLKENKLGGASAHPRLSVDLLVIELIVYNS